jgi:hypothetical protein
MKAEDFDIVSTISRETDTPIGCILLLLIMIGIVALLYARSLGGPIW